MPVRGGGVHTIAFGQKQPFGFQGLLLRPVADDSCSRIRPIYLVRELRAFGGQLVFLDACA